MSVSTADPGSADLRQWLRPRSCENMLREFWYVACAAARLGAEPRAAQVLDKEIVLFRDDAGKAHALLNRCCHRGVKLSLGRVTNGNLACGYHGWQYNGGGKCVKVPSLPQQQSVPGTFRVPAFKCVEQDSYIWVWMGAGDPLPQEPTRIPDFDLFDWSQGVSPVACSATMLIENQFDSAHPAFAHAGTHPSYFASRANIPKEYTFEVRTTDAGMVAFHPCADSEDAPIPEKFKSLTRLELPSRVYVHQQIFGISFFVLLHIVPTGAATCRLEWLQRQKNKHPGSVTWVDQETKLIEQDRLLLESAQPAYDRGDDFERSVGADFVTVMVRKVMSLAAGGRWQSDRTQLPKRHLVSLRG
jgi:phenylpropionate dioxygenase-like ring-hydroxylating dioxygenase large terminal subunit